MIYIKTRMRKMPEWCTVCDYYIKGDHYMRGRRCRACNRELRGEAKVTYEHPAWCPLVEREEQAND